MTTDQQVTAQTQAPENQQNSFAVPDAYKDRGWVEKIKSPDDLWKTLDNAQSLLGKRPAGIPSNDAPEEEWQKFIETARPEKPEMYKLPDVDGVPEGFDLAPFKGKAINIMYEAGLTQKQAERLWKSYIGSELGSVAENSKAQEARQSELDAEFDALTKQHFGGDFEAVSKVATDMVNQYVPAELRGAYAELSDNPKALAAFAAAMKGAHDEIAKVRKEYGAEGSLGSGSQAASQDIGEVRKELAALRTSQSARNFLDKDHAKTMQRISELGEIVDKHYRQ